MTDIKKKLSQEILKKNGSWIVDEISHW